VPKTSTIGQSLILATGATSHLQAIVPIYIANTWLDPGSDAGHSGFEPNDPSYNGIYFLGSGSGVDPAWDYIAGSGITTSAAVADGVAYVGDASGQLLAIDTGKGSNLWTWQDASGAAIDGAPTVDPALGQVMVGTADGAVDAISTSTGHLVWSASVAGAANAPTFGNGEAYVTSSDGTDGAVTALVESTGALAWTRSLAGPVASSATLDKASQLVVVGDNDGSVVALSAGSGSPAWTFIAGGAVHASPVIYAGSVYVGSTDGTLSALSETTGHRLWSHSTGAPITASPAIYPRTPPEVFAGAGDGSLTGLSTVDGSVESVNQYGAAVTGIAAVNEAVFATTATGVVDAIRADGREGAWTHDMGSATDTPPAIVDGAVYIGDAAGNLIAFTPYGQAPR
jgi:outer membrane protein assembly factor BamB